MHADNSVGEVGIQTHAWCQRDGQVGEEAHTEGGEGSDGSSGGDQIALHFLDAHEVLGIGGTEIGHAFFGTNAGSACLGGDVTVDGDNVCHSEESGQTSAQLREEETAFPFVGLIPAG